MIRSLDSLTYEAKIKILRTDVSNLRHMSPDIKLHLLALKFDRNRAIHTITLPTSKFCTDGTYMSLFPCVDEENLDKYPVEVILKLHRYNFTFTKEQKEFRNYKQAMIELFI